LLALALCSAMAGVWGFKARAHNSRSSATASAFIMGSGPEVALAGALPDEIPADNGLTLIKVEGVSPGASWRAVRIDAGFTSGSRAEKPFDSGAFVGTGLSAIAQNPTLASGALQAGVLKGDPVAAITVTPTKQDGRHQGEVRTFVLTVEFN
jgi:hypothetical protein